VAEQGDYFRTRLSQMTFAEPGSVRVIGLAIGVEFGQDSDYATKLGDRCREAGLLVSAEEDNLLTLFPALTIDREVVRQGLDILEARL
jgi:4-aminobutyrate aminotransferase-like enzyme